VPVYCCLHNGCQVARKRGACALFVRKPWHLGTPAPQPAGAAGAGSNSDIIILQEQVLQYYDVT
jgi:hypothetical protein